MDTMGFKGKWAPELEGQLRPLRDFMPHPENARKHNIDRIKASLLDHGQRTPITVQASTMFVCKGNGTWEAARQLGWDHIAVSIQDMDDARALAYLYADNRASDGAGYDRKRLIAGLEKMVAGPGLTGTLWDIDELENLIADEDAVPTVEAEVEHKYAEPEELAAARAAKAESSGEKKREVPLVYTLADHALFVGWIKTLQARWKTGGTMATVFQAVKRQAELEAGGAVTTGAVLGTSAAALERYAALKDFRDTLITLGEDTYRKSFLLAQLQGAMSELAPNGVPTPVAPAAEPEITFGEPELADETPEAVAQVEALLAQAAPPQEEEPAPVADPFEGLDLWSTATEAG